MTKGKIFYGLGAMLWLLFWSPGFVAQNEDLPVPAPAKTIAAEDRTVLDALTKPKERSKKAVELAGGRLKQAETLMEKQDYPGALEQLGRYQGIIAHTMAFLKPYIAQRLREPFRNMEVALRAHIPRIEGLRRQTPVAYGVHIRAIGEYARSARAEALNAFFDDTVISDNNAQPEAEAKKEIKPVKP